MKSKLVAILLVVCMLCGCSYDYAYDTTEGLTTEEVYIPVESVCDADNIEEVVETTNDNVAKEDVNTGGLSEAVSLAEMCAQFTGDENRDKAEAMAIRVAESEECTPEDLMILATSEYPEVWFHAIYSSDANTEETLMAFAKNIVTLGQCEDGFDKLYEEQAAHNISEVIIEDKNCTLPVLEILVTSKCMYVWKFAVLDEDNSEATLYKLAQNVATIDGGWVEEEWAERLAGWIVIHDKCTDNVRGALMGSPFEDVWDIAMNYD